MSHAAPIDLPAFLDRLRAEGELVEVDAEVDPRLEMAEIHRRVIAAGGPAVLFKRPKGAAFPAVTNLFGSARRVQLAFGDRPEDIVARVARLPEEALPPTPSNLWAQRGLFASLARVGLKRRRRGPVTEVVEDSPDLS
ncbi:MAG: UbiD family decarboxylase, partial [Paracoccaceae bacterium]